jgi:hypothetical protein
VWEAKIQRWYTGPAVAGCAPERRYVHGDMAMEIDRYIEIERERERDR